MNFITPKIKNRIIGIVSSGFVSGFCLGCFPNKLSIHFENEKYKSILIPIMSGMICSMAITFSPFLMINYLCNGTYFDILFDKYDIDIKRYHQGDGEGNKYGYPSSLILNVKYKNIND